MGARENFESAKKDIVRLFEIHSQLGGKAQGRRKGLEVLNKSALVLTCACWELFVEDLAVESAEKIADKFDDPTKLPLEIRKAIAKAIKDDKNDLSPWLMTGVGWKTVFVDRIKRAAEGRVSGGMNTPKAPQVDELILLATGLKNVSDRWRWQGMTAAGARAKLEKLVVTRGTIAHRVADENPVYRHECKSYLIHVENLVWYTRDAVVTHLKSM